MSAAHTPGPWQVGTQPPIPGWALAVVGEGRVVCDLTMAGNAEADARLIAAAPDLLAALQAIETICTESPADCRKRMGTRVGNTLVAVRAALAKVQS
jgi:hypothetical protein